MVRCSKDRGEGGSVVRADVVRADMWRGAAKIVVRCSKDRGEVQQTLW